MSIPSVKTIESAFKKWLQPGDAQKIRKLMEGAGSNRSVEEALEAIDKIIGASGVETIRGGDNHGGFWQDAVLAYVNMGDPYVATVWYEPRYGMSGRWGVGGYGDWVEYWEREHSQLEGLKAPRRGSFMRVPGAKGRALAGAERPLLPSSWDSPSANKPMAAKGLTSYRCKGAYGWIMIGASSTDDAMREARRSSPNARREDLQVWDGRKYVDVPGAKGRGLGTYDMPKAYWVVEKVIRSTDTKNRYYPIHVEGTNLANETPVKFFWGVKDLSDPRYDLTKAKIDPAAIPFIGRKVPGLSGLGAARDLNDNDREQWVNNDEGLYSWWKSTRQPIRTFVRENRDELTEAINKVLNAPPRQKSWRNY